MKLIRYICSIILFFSMTAGTVITAQAALRVQETEAEIVVVIDPGHGGENLGTIENGFLEKEMTMITAQAMFEELSLYDGIKVYMTRTEDIDLSLKERAEYAASVEADFLFSLHYNASASHNRYGTEIWIPAKAPYHSYGYQFGYGFIEEMQNMGLYNRGIKTRLNEEKEDYYGIIREAVALSVPSVILEHCHVDESQDSSYCDTDDELMAFGKADATAVAKYFGLKSDILGVDYSTEYSLPEVNKNSTVKYISWDETAPDVCMIELINAERKNDVINITLQVTAADYDSLLVFYDYSSDGGNTYSALQPWPENNPLNGSYKDSLELTLNIPYENKIPEIVLRCYNLYDTQTESNPVMVPVSVLASEEEEPEASTDPQSDTKAPVIKEEKKTPGTTTFMPLTDEPGEGDDGSVSFLSFLKLCLIVVIIIFFIVIISQALTYSKRKRRRRQRRNESGNNRNQPR